MRRVAVCATGTTTTPLLRVALCAAPAAARDLRRTGVDDTTGGAGLFLMLTRTLPPRLGVPLAGKCRMPVEFDGRAHSCQAEPGFY
jgi:hypothetical protein